MKRHKRRSGGTTDRPTHNSRASVARRIALQRPVQRRISPFQWSEALEEAIARDRATSLEQSIAKEGELSEVDHQQRTDRDGRQRDDDNRRGLENGHDPTLADCLRLPHSGIVSSLLGL
jgi:hypothetical protein